MHRGHAGKARLKGMIRTRGHFRCPGVGAHLPAAGGHGLSCKGAGRRRQAVCPRDGTAHYTQNMDCRGLVMEDRGRTALVRVARVNCAQCGGCGFFARRREHTLEFEAVNTVGAHEGEEVLMHVPPRRLALLYLYAFGIPLLAMGLVFGMVFLCLYLWGFDGPQGPSVIAAAAAGLVSFWLGSRLSARKEVTPEITEVLRKFDVEGLPDDYRGEVL